VLCVLCGGCGFRSSPAINDGTPPIDGTVPPDTSSSMIDAAIDAPSSPAADCWGHWMDHAPQVSGVTELTALSTTGNERDPWVSDDGLEMYFARQSAGGTSDIYRANRASTSQPWGNVGKLVNLSTSTSDEGRPALSSDERMLALSSNAGGQFDILVIARPDTGVDFGSPNRDRLGAINTGATQHYDPFLVNGGKTLYLAPARNGSTQHIVVSTRAKLEDDFPAATQVPVINSTGAGEGDADPAPSADERVIVFSSTRGGGAGQGDLYYATRASAAQDFGAPSRIPVVNGGADDGDPMLSPDGCTLYFSSTRNGGDYDVYSAQITR
jgi:Tol biopolymer transport system component